jgi:hypothetical protein
MIYSNCATHIIFSASLKLKRYGQKKSRAIVGTVGAFLGLTWTAVILRIYVGRVILKKLQLSDSFTDELRRLRSSGLH